ncbi:transient receptor potential cation channel protein painless-like isoform X1 [Palaemon carinicauda]|uniref:transient receptor potential cation channel protein painless-like isoform X1 n=2 Tax=Palaemon carinicauda TaxID=392227 RepID=UPI0035B633B1
MVYQLSASVPLNVIHSQRDHYREMRNALINGDPKALQFATSHLSSADLDRCYKYNADDFFSISASSLPKDMQDDLLHKRITKISPLHYVAMLGNKKCLEILLEAGANPNIKNSYGQTPLHILPRGWARNPDKDFEGCFETLMSYKNTDPNRLDLSNSTPYSEAKKYQWTFMMNQLETSEPDSLSDKRTSLMNCDRLTVLADALLKELLNEDLEEFKITLDAIKASIANKVRVVDESHGSYTLLQYASKRGLTGFVDELLKYGASPTKKDNINILSAVFLATKHGHHKILRKLVYSMTKEDLESGSLRMSNEDQETPLHMAVICYNSQKSDEVNYYQCLQILLEYKRFMNLDAQNDDGNTALHYSALCRDLRAFCDLLNSGADFNIRNIVGSSPLHYIKKEGMLQVLDNFIKINTNEKIIDKNFWISLDYGIMNRKKDISLTACNSSTVATEMDFLRLVSEIFEDSDILYHPLLDVFMNIKWQNIRRYFYVNFVIHFVFIVLIIAYIVAFHWPQNTNNSTKAVDYTGVKSLYEDNSLTSRKVFVAVLLLVLFLWQIVQLLIMNSWKIYLQNVKRMSEIVTIILTIVLLFVPCAEGIKMGVAAWVVVLTSLEFILQLGQLPLFSVYITMFNTIAWNFFKFLSLFASVLFAFSFSFYILLYSFTGTFSSFFASLLKIVIMTTGELEYGDLPISDSASPEASKVLLALFIFLVLLVLMNLLNGLAISDIQDIQRRAEIISRINLIERIDQLEKAFYCKNTRNPVKKILDMLFNFTRTFRHCLPKYKLMIYISRNPIEYSNSKTHGNFVCHCHSYTVQEKNLELLKRIAMDKKEKPST